MKEKIFTRGNGEKVTYSKAISIIASYLAASPKAEYEVTIGTDSQTSNVTKYSEVIAIHRIGDGGIFFYHNDYVERVHNLKDKIYEETYRSLNNANGFIDALDLELIKLDVDINTLNIHFQIHCDVGHDGKTRTLIREVTAWVESLGYEVSIKPESYAASSIANKISK